jgi:serine/threonine protein kinase/Tol biopolymer transport system component
MSVPEERKNNRPSKKRPPPTASLSDSVAGPGSQIGPFRIEQELGRGGAGVVYLAHDTKLDRSVAIKSLPAEVKDNPKALSRFTREARVLASLNHPNIATIYDELEEAEGLSYLVLEYVPGQTLAERIAKKLLKLEEALTIALQIAEAVAAAHERDVIHRDLKPGNIKITQEGKVKVLDFGLAKVVGGEATDQQTTITEPGRVIGTPAYMSPEQARGQVTDKRADIWSFGCVFYEMLTGIVPFRGETVSDTLANILQTNPDWQTLPETTPTNIRVLLRRCLEKDPRRRLQHIGDAAIEISETLNLPAFMPPVTVSSAAVARHANQRRVIPVVGACLVITAVASSLITWILNLDQLPPGNVSRVSIQLPQANRLDFWGGHLSLVLSPDGRQLVYVGKGDGNKTHLYIRSINGFEVKPISGTEGAYLPFFSPDSRWVGFFADDKPGECKLKKLSVSGNKAVTTLVNKKKRYFGGSWGDDNTIVFSSDDPTEGTINLFKVSADGGNPEPITTIDSTKGEINHVFPQILPGGKAVLFGVMSDMTFNKCHIELLLLETGKREKLFDDILNVQYSPTGHLVFGRDGKMRAAPFDLKKLKVTRSDVQMPGNIRMGFRGRFTPFSIASNGTLIYIPPAETCTLLWVADQNDLVPFAAIPDLYLCPRLSPDEEQIAVTVIDGKGSQVWIYDRNRNSRSQLTFEGDNNVLPCWVPPEGERLAFSSGRRVKGARQLFWQPVGHSVEAESLLQLGKNVHYPVSWSPNGRFLAYMESTLDTWNIWILPVENDGKPGEPRPFLCDEGSNEVSPMFRPTDGRWIAYVSNKTRQEEVYIREFQWDNLSGGREIQISSGGGTEPVWSRDGSKLFYRSSKEMMEVTIDPDPDIKSGVGVPHPLFKDNAYERGGDLSDYDIASDGRFLMVQESAPTRIEAVLNWFEELKRLAPTGKEY